MTSEPGSDPNTNPESKTNPSTDPSPKPPKHHASLGSFGFILSLLVLGLVAGAGLSWVYFSNPRVDFHMMSYLAPAVTQLAGEFSDKDGDLVADTPPESQQLDPKELHFTVLPPSGKDDKEKEKWQEFLDHISKLTGKPVQFSIKIHNRSSETEELKAGKTHIQQLSTGQVPTLVNQAGFVPAFVMADEKGNHGYTMKIITRKDSGLNHLKDLKGTTITLTSLRSYSSFRGPILLLWEKEKLMPGRDYQYIGVEGQREAVKGLASKTFSVTSVASDYFERICADEKLSVGDFKVLYESPSLPPACFGYTHKLKPELVAKIREAFLTFDWKGTKIEKAYQASNQVKFVEVDYRKLWAPIRDQDVAWNNMIDRDKALSAAAP